ncbi:hypothetical protein AB0I81_57310 [Nonomuraea sp. NPDC050404]|uniref:hypothetical protein n=1 Tax=Nonomuraea sp. NPDC050404 TaxID=3155783 RepID=UPI0033CB0F68
MAEDQRDVRVEMKMLMSVTDVRALTDTAVEMIEREGVWHIGPGATPAQKQEEIDKIKADPAHAVSNLIAYMHLDDLIAKAVPGLEAGEASVAARVGDTEDLP